MTKISVVMISHNDIKEYLKQSIDSILGQQDVDVQLILSTVNEDHAVKIAQKRGCRDIVTSNEPSIYGQINRGVELVSGDWFCCAGGNDVMLPFKLKDEMGLCLAKGKKVCYSSSYETDSLLNIVSTMPCQNYDYSQHLSNNFVSDNALVRVDLMRKYMPFREEFDNYGYWDLWLRIAEGERDVFVYNDKPNYLYRRGGPSRSDRKMSNRQMWKYDEKCKMKMLAAHGVKYKPIEYEFRYGWRREQNKPKVKGK